MKNLAIIPARGGSKRIPRKNIKDFQAAEGSSQLQRADAGLAKRKEIAQGYLEDFSRKSFIKSQSEIVAGHAYYNS